MHKWLCSNRRNPNNMQSTILNFNSLRPKWNNIKIASIFKNTIKKKNKVMLEVPNLDLGKKNLTNIN